MQIPNEIRVAPGMQTHLEFSLPTTATVVTKNPDVVQINGEISKSIAVDLSKPLILTSREQGETELAIEVAGFPIKKMKVNVMDDVRVYLGGQSVGVKLMSNGMMVVGHHMVDGKEKKHSPSLERIKVGDMILKINNQDVTSIQNVSKLVNQYGSSGKPLLITIRRDGQIMDVEVTPVFDVKDESYRLGLYIRDSAAGIGTLTFVHPQSKRFGALGHVISDMDTGKPIDTANGHIVHSRITAIQKGEHGQPGEKYASFVNEDQPLGQIEKNTAFGVFGSVHGTIKNEFFSNPLPVALQEQVEVGPAKIYTVIKGEQVEAFDIEIVKVIPQKYPSTKGMIIRVTDPKLLKETGGIVQGMSGSPIVQNNRIVGAVTHVFVNDPTSGYGIHIEWMLKEAGIDIQSSSLHKRKAS